MSDRLSGLPKNERHRRNENAGDVHPLQQLEEPRSRNLACETSSESPETARKKAAGTGIAKHAESLALRREVQRG